jgi:GNAT superfamily N-acetyltransferase
MRIQREAWLATYPSSDHGITRAMIEERFAEISPDESIDKWRRRIEKEGPDHTMLVARLDGQVEGFVGCRRAKGRQRIGSMYVLPSEQGHGIGGQLLRRAITWFDRDQDIYLDVVSYNDHAIGFYKHFGFEETGVTVQDAVRPFANGTKIPEIEMVLRAA